MYDKPMQLALIETSLVTLLLCLSSGDGTKNRFVSCLPEDIKLEEVVSVPELRTTSPATGKIVTVREILLRLKAHCRKGKLVDGAGREVYFYRLVGCWGNPPEDYQEQFARQNAELLRLKKKYRVVEIPCPQADPRQVY